MSTSEAETLPLQDVETSGDRRSGFLATGGVIGAILASTCCVVPLLFVMLGVSGAWIGSLTALEPYRLYFAIATLVFVTLGFRQVYFKAKPACVDESYCAKSQSAIVIKAALWFSTAAILLAQSINWWAPFLY